MNKNTLRLFLRAKVTVCNLSLSYSNDFIFHRTNPLFLKYTDIEINLSMEVAGAFPSYQKVKAEYTVIKLKVYCRATYRGLTTTHTPEGVFELGECPEKFHMCTVRNQEFSCYK